MGAASDDDDDDEFAAGAEASPTARVDVARRSWSAAAPHVAPCSRACTWGACAAAFAAAALAAAIFGRRAQLDGALLYDDKAAVLGSPVVQGEVPLSAVWTRDFWGKDDVASKESHKSYRPLVTLSYILNHRLNTRAGLEGNEPYWYHVVSVALHAAVSALVVPAVLAAFGWRERGLLLPCVSALLFAAHPVHVEAVQNMVGRAEVMMALFYLLGFLAYAHIAVGGPAAAELPSLAPVRLSSRALCGIGVTLLCALCSMLCKETGVTLPLLCATWDVLVVVGAEPRLLRAYLLHRRADGGHAWLWARAPAAAARYGLLGAGCALLALWRKGLNGGTPVEFARKQNMPIWHPHPLWRAISIVWVWMEYAWVTFVPTPLACDWSWPAISTVDGVDDVRCALALGYCVAWAALLRAHAVRATSVRALVCALFALCPFLLASNLLVGVGTCKAERVLYLPSLGGCVALALALHCAADALGRRGGGGGCAKAPRALAWALGLALVGAYAAQCARYAAVWRTGVGLWEHTLRVQEARPAWTRSAPTLHAIGEYGLQLSWAGRNSDAEAVLERQIRLSERERATALAGGTGRAGGAADDAEVDLGGYGPLALVYRMNGEPYKALACAEKAIELFELARADGKGESKKRELGLILGARALALFLVRPQLAMGEMRRALAISNGQDVVVAKLAEQLLDGYRRVGADPAEPFPPPPRSARALRLGGGGDGGGGGNAPAAVAGVADARALLAADPALRALVESARVQAILAELRVNPAAVSKYEDDPQLRELARRVGAPATAAATSGSTLGGGELPESLDELNAWLRAGERAMPAAGAAQRLEPAARALDGAVPPELGPLPAYATGAAGDPLETRARGVAERAHGASEAARSRLPLDGPPTAHGARALAAFKLGAQLANGGDPARAIGYYCDALAIFARCAHTSHCAVGIVDSLHIKLKLHAALVSRVAEHARAGHCTEQLAARAFQRVAARLRGAGDAEAAEYADGVARLTAVELGEAFAGGAAGGKCAEAEALCGVDARLLDAL